MVERVLVQQVRFVEQEDRMHALAGELLDMGTDGAEEISGRGATGEAESVAELAIEVAPAEGGVVAVGQAEAALRERMTQGAQHARLADAGLAQSTTLLRLVERFDQFVEQGQFAGGSQRSASSISLVNGSADRPKMRQSVGVH